MLSKLKYIFLLVILGGLMLGFQVRNDEDPEKEKILLSLIRYALTKGHYEPIQINDEFSEKVFDEFLNNLDPSKRLFLQSDIDEFAQYKYLIDDQIKNEDLTFFNLVYERYNLRLGESKKYYKEIFII